MAQLCRFRGEFRSCLTARSDTLFEPADTALCGDGPVRSLVDLSLVGERPPQTPAALGSPTCDTSTSSTPSASPSRPWAGPDRRSAPQGSQPMDLADRRRLHPAAACPAPGSRPSPAMGETQSAGQADSRPHPPRFPARPPSGRLPGPGTESLPPRPQTTTRPQEHPAPQNTTDATTNEEVDDPTARRTS